MLKNVLPALGNEFISLIKETSILATIGVVELTKVATILSARTLDPLVIFAFAAVGYLLITSMVSLIFKFLEKKVSHDNIW